MKSVYSDTVTLFISSPSSAIVVVMVCLWSRLWEITCHSSSWL